MPDKLLRMLFVLALACAATTVPACIFFPNPDRDSRCKEFRTYLNYETARADIEEAGEPIDRYYESYMCSTLYNNIAIPQIDHFLSRPQESVTVIKRNIPRVRTDKEILIASHIILSIHKSGAVNVSCDKELLASWEAVLVRMRPSWLADKAWSFHQATLAAPGLPCGQ